MAGFQMAHNAPDYKYPGRAALTRVGYVEYLRSLFVAERPPQWKTG